MTRILSVTQAKYNVVNKMIVDKTAYIETHCRQPSPVHESVRCVHARFELKRLKRLSIKLKQKLEQQIE